MFIVIFEVHPKAEQWDDYLGAGQDAEARDSSRSTASSTTSATEPDARGLDPLAVHLARREGAGALAHPGAASPAQESGPLRDLRDYHLRVGQVTSDTHVPPGQHLREQRLDETEIGDAHAISIVEMQRPADMPANASPEQIAGWLGLRDGAMGLVSWDLFDAILTPGKLLLMLAWRDAAREDLAVGAAGGAASARAGDPRLRHVPPPRRRRNTTRRWRLARLPRGRAGRNDSGGSGGEHRHETRQFPPP